MFNENFMVTHTGLLNQRHLEYLGMEYSGIGDTPTTVNIKISAQYIFSRISRRALDA